MLLIKQIIFLQHSDQKPNTVRDIQRNQMIIMCFNLFSCRHSSQGAELPLGFYQNKKNKQTKICKNVKNLEKNSTSRSLQNIFSDQCLKNRDLATDNNWMSRWLFPLLFCCWLHALRSQHALRCFGLIWHEVVSSSTERRGYVEDSAMYRTC